ncbi:MAG: NDP-sugar synthase [Chthoniobacterales bacterium]|nr:NDP-sugar synthase [Chthoniobacterales bacterium]
MRSAFVLGAGYGTRLRPLTDNLPKPLVPVFNKALIEYVLDGLIARGFERFAINTHYLAERWKEKFGVFDGKSEYRGCEVFLFYERELLDTGGGLKNIESFIQNDGLLVWNGDVLCDASLEGLVGRHEEAGFAVTLGLRRGGGPLSVSFDSAEGVVRDIRGCLGRRGDVECLFAGIYAVRPEVLRWIPPGRPYSIVTALVEMLRAGFQIGGVILEDGLWSDLGTVESYLEAHHFIKEKGYRLGYALREPLRFLPKGMGWREGWGGFVSIGDGSIVEEEVFLEDTVVWPGSCIRSGSRLRRCVVVGGKEVRGVHEREVL